jgi:twitching motility protein PilT
MAEGQPVDTHTPNQGSPKINKFFKAAIKIKASDLHLKVGQSAKLRIFNSLKSTTGDPITAEHMEEIVYEILRPDQKAQFIENGTLDFAYAYDSDNRFRVNIFRQRGTISLVARYVNNTVPSFEALHLPPILGKIASHTEGLVMVVGPTGCGKTTTIAAMLDYITQNRACHIVTVEDPIEYIFKDNKAIVSQREIGLDVPSFEDALTYLMRQDPDVVLIGEMRDARTVTAGMRAAETGHLVFGTLHSTNAPQAIHRLLDLFPQSERDLVRQSLALTIRAVISQVLMPSIMEGVDRVPAMEILLANPSTKKLIAEGREADLHNLIRSAKQEGMQYLTDNLCSLVMEGMIDPKEGFKYAPNEEELRMALKGIRTTSEGIL